MDTVRFTQIASPLGELLATDHGSGLSGLYFPGHQRGPEIEAAWRRDVGPFRPLIENLEVYFEGGRPGFAFPLDLRGTELQIQVWEALLACPYGRTTSYGQIARTVDRPSASRAVAGAIGRNPVSIVVPCHRVIGADGRLTGYAGGLPRKQQLLRLEGVLAA
jgi:methylated-DNA-[protein]-cysteine S-methyltransferase